MGEDATPPGALDFRLIRDPLDTALDALKNRIDRDWPGRLASIPGARALLLTMVKVAITTYGSVRYLVQDYPKECLPNSEFAISIPPLSRSLLDQLFTVVFLAEDLSARTAWYYKAGWREERETYERYRDRYGSRPEWAAWLEGYARALDRSRVEWGISDEEAAHLDRIKRWPIPSRMAKRKDLQPDTRAFLQYLDAWFYRALSQDAHLSFPGLARRGAPLLLPRGPERTERLDKWKSQGMFTTITIILALATEIEHLLQFGICERLAFVWRVLVEHWEEARDLYEMRCARLLEGGPTHGTTR